MRPLIVAMFLVMVPVAIWLIARFWVWVFHVTSLFGKRRRAASSRWVAGETTARRAGREGMVQYVEVFLFRPGIDGRETVSIGRAYFNDEDFDLKLYELRAEAGERAVVLNQGKGRRRGLLRRG